MTSPAIRKWFAGKAFGPVALCWLATLLPAAGQLPPSPTQPAHDAVPEIKLNGLTTILGDKRALFKARYDSGLVESYFLAEGQSAGAFKLLSVDIHSNKIKVNNHGVVQTIALCAPPDLSVLAAPAGNADQPFADHQNFAMNSGDRGPAANTTATGTTKVQNSGTDFPAGSANGSQAGSPSNTAATPDDRSQNSGDTDNPGAPNSISQGSEPYSLRAAREFERLRIETADGVYNGTDEPIPLTPLTPPGTPKALIGPDRAWFPD